MTRKNFLLKSGAPIKVIASHRLGKKSRSAIRRRNKEVREIYQKVHPCLDTTRDWFSDNIAAWAQTFNTYLIEDETPINALEIGSFEGRSAHFQLYFRSNLHLTCVDTWQGSDEHGEDLSFSEVEQRFDRNTEQFSDRIEKFRGTSLQYFASMEGQREVFDFVYIDGSHHADDVLIDAVKGFELLKCGGVIIFDDFLWDYYSETRWNPCAAICAFLRMVDGDFEVLYCDYQLHLRKTKVRRN